MHISSELRTQLVSELTDTLKSLPAGINLSALTVDGMLEQFLTGEAMTALLSAVRSEGKADGLREVAGLLDTVAPIGELPVSDVVTILRNAANRFTS